MTTTHLIPRADCLDCDWAPDPDARASLDRQAEKHTAPGHPTVSGGSPEVRR